jgi:hypothetical protein
MPKRQTAKHQRRQSTVVPPLAVDFKTALSKLLRVKPMPRKTKKPTKRDEQA